MCAWSRVIFNGFIIKKVALVQFSSATGICFFARFCRGWFWWWWTIWYIPGTLFCSGINNTHYCSEHWFNMLSMIICMPPFIPLLETTYIPIPVTFLQIYLKWLILNYDDTAFKADDVDIFVWCCFFLFLLPPWSGMQDFSTSISCADMQIMHLDF